MALLDANTRYKKDDDSALKEIQEIMHNLCVFYPKHIEKEDKHFFVPVMDYFSKKELESMHNEFNEWDRSMIHEKYRSLVELLEKK
jgi:hemerythrin-like domain-containing protein